MGGCRLIDFMADFWFFFKKFIVREGGATRRSCKSQKFMLIWRLWRLSTKLIEMIKSCGWSDWHLIIKLHMQFSTIMLS
jgi:hypothetical protein